METGPPLHSHPLCSTASHSLFLETRSLPSPEESSDSPSHARHLSLTFPSLFPSLFGPSMSCSRIWHLRTERHGERDMQTETETPIER